MTTEKITMWEHKLLDLGLRNQLINMHLNAKTIPLFVPSLAEFEDLLVSGEDFIVISGKKEDIEEKTEDLEAVNEESVEEISEGNNEEAKEEAEEATSKEPLKTLPRKEYGFEDMHDISGFEELVTAKFKEKKIMAPITQRDLDERIKKLYRGYKNSLEENGANTLYVAMGLLKWYEGDDDSPAHYAPLLLVPIQIVRNSLALGYKIRIREEDTMFNISIREKLKAEYDINIEGLEELPTDDNGTDLKKVFEIVRAAIEVKPSWEVLESGYIGLFSFTQFVMWHDLKGRGEDVLKSSIVSSLVNGSYEGAATAPKETDTKKPDESKALMPLPADSSQLEAINAAYEGESFVLHGPPGTGKSQTITSMIANCLYQGKKVLFAAEKKAALEVVYNRLSKIGLAPFCLELHSNKARKSDVLAQLDSVLKLKEKYSPEEFESKSKELREKKAALDGYAKELHEVRPCGYSLFELISIYETSKDVPDIEPFGEKTLPLLEASFIEMIQSELTELVFIGKQYKSSGASVLDFVDGSSYAMTMRDRVPLQVTEYKKALMKLSELASGKSIADINAECDKYEEGRKTAKMRDEILYSWDKDFLKEDARLLIKEYKEAQTKWALFKVMGISSVYKKVAVYDIKKDKKDTLLDELNRLYEYSDREKEYPIVKDSSLYDAYDKVKQLRQDLESMLGLRPLTDLSTDISYCDTLLNNIELLKIRMQYNKEISKLKGFGAMNLAQAYDEGIVDEDNIGDALNKRYSYQLVTSIIDSVSLLSEFSGTVFEGRIEVFRRLSEEYMELCKKEIYLKLASRIPSASSASIPGSELTKLKKAIAGNARGISLRKLFSEIPNILQLLCPCMLMSPMSVAQYLELDDFKFDTVIFDEASQLPTCKAVGVIARGDNAIIVGDPRQMPPTSFFMSANFDEDNQEIEDLESILDDCLAVNMPSRYLRWHYRSRHESLIDFSNKVFYENRLLTFPSADDRKSMVTLVDVGGIFDRGRTRTNLKEAEAVVEDIVRRFKDPELKKQSIGVVTFNISQQNKIDDLLQEECKRVEGLEEWAYSSEEPIFIKNLENVQGDERDVILFSVAYGKIEDGHIYMNFGPLNLEGGWRRLNVAVTRARCEMKVFSSLLPEQIRSNTLSRGVLAMKRFLEYASGSSVWASGLEDGYVNDNVPGSPRKAFSGVADRLAAALEENGYKISRDIGKSGYKIDIGIVDEESEGRYCAGILIDGDSYKNAQTTRDRELAQLSILEGLGWKVMRVWSLDYLEDTDKTLEKVIEFIKTPLPVKEEVAAVKEETVTEEIKAEEESELQNTAEETSASPAAEEDILTSYKIASVPTVELGYKEFMKPSNNSILQDKIREILAQEAPISNDLLARRLAQAVGAGNVTAKVKERCSYLCESAKIIKTSRSGKDFWWHEEPSSYKKVRTASDAATRRDVSDIPWEEAVNAVSYIVKVGVGMPKDSIPSDTAKMLGYVRPKAELIALLEEALKHCINEEILKEGLGGSITVAD